jgi:hypothetical protein
VAKGGTSGGSAIIGGEDSGDDENSVIMLVHYDPETKGVSSCTGALLAPRLVLTARHCVAVTDPSAACLSDGSPASATSGRVYDDFSPSSLYVFVGEKRPNFAAPTAQWKARGSRILHDDASYLCNHDLALVLLDAPVQDVPIAKVRLNTEPWVGESLKVIGWGVTEQSDSPAVRQRRSGVLVELVGSSRGRRGVDIGPNEFLVGESICSGDSGGPAFGEETDAVVGVVSRGGNGSGGSDESAAASCIGGRNVYTRLAPFRDLILEGYALAGQEPWLEGLPDPRLASEGQSCTQDADCRSNVCKPTGPKGGVCGALCEGDDCAAVAAAAYVSPLERSPMVRAGCSVGGASLSALPKGGLSLGGWSLFLMALGFRRRRPR